MPKKLKKLDVFIPTRGRTGYSSQSTLRQFLELSSNKPWIVCPEEEVKTHKQYHDRVIACPAQGIGPTRQWILNNAQCDIIVMADDDMYFSYREDPRSTKLSSCKDLTPLLRRIRCAIDAGFIHGGVGARQGNNHKTLEGPRQGVLTKEGHLVVDCDRVNNLHFLDKEKVWETGCDFDCPGITEDFFFTLSLLTQGVPNRVFHDYVWNQRGSGATGGCSLYRTEQVQSEWSEGLKSAFPEFVSVVEKKSKPSSPAWKDFKTRKDVRIQWLKAFNSSKKESKNG